MDTTAQTDTNGAPIPSAKMSVKPIRKHIKVLIVDDEPEVCRTVGLLLEHSGYQVVTSCNPSEGIQLVSQESFHLAMIDLKMPDMDGIDVIEQFKRIDERINCIMMTAYPDLETATAAMRAGARDYVTKPFKQDELLGAVDRACRAMGLVYTNETELNSQIGQRIREARLNRNMTLRQLSELTELTTSQLSQVELGKNAASIWALARISSALGYQLSVLLRGL
ncbi:MAG: Regulator of RpoS [Phycisphaerae bacterium]|nr:Regulator of RpoS [Phycisphaerae bacterium]